MCVIIYCSVNYFINLFFISSFFDSAYEEGDPLKDMGAGCFDCLALHKNGLFTAGKVGSTKIVF